MRVALNASLDPESKAELQRLAEANGLGVSAMLRVLIHRAIGDNQGDVPGVRLPADGHCLVVWTAEDDPADSRWEIPPADPTDAPPVGDLDAMRKLSRRAKDKPWPAKAMAVRT